MALGLASIVAAALPGVSRGEAAMAESRSREPVSLSEEHIAAVNRPRRIIVNNDVGYPLESFEVSVERWIAARFSLFDEPGSQVDCISWCLDEGNLACYPSKVLPEVRYPGLQRWLDAGTDIVKVMAEETHKRGLEAFWEYRLNGTDREADLNTPARLPMKEQHPDWLIEGSWWGPGLWNFAVEGVRDYKVAILREVAQNYDYDGISIDFGRHPPALPIGRQWEHRDAMTDFIRRLRLMLQEVAQERGRPFLLSVRVPATVAGCHYDGLDIERWARENLVDVIVMGVRSTEVDVAGFRRVTAGTHIRLYACIDDGHSTDGYHRPPIEFFRGLAANWWRQGVDGIVTFNFANESAETAPTIGLSAFAPHRQAYHEIGEPEAIRYKDKMFVLQRRYGGGWDGLAAGWGALPGGTAHLWDFYQNMNSQAPLPVTLPADGLPVVLSLYVADDLGANAERLDGVELRMLLSGATADDVVEAKVNGVLLAPPAVQEGGWRVFAPKPEDFAVGVNLISVRVAQAHGPVTVEKLEAHVDYRD
jgi:hypothetical protein